MAAVIGLFGILLRQPLIVSFIAVGLIAGPSALDVVRSDEQIDLLSELGIAVLLFLVGIKLDVKLIRSLGAVSLLTGLGQVAFTSIFGYLIGLALGLGHVTSLYVAVALTFSSTIIIVKLLSDKREIDSLHGQIALGFLIVQDLVVVLAMIVLSAIGIGAPPRAAGMAAGRSCRCWPRAWRWWRWWSCSFAISPTR
jgi:Kef-type K+ transport system membrane component KefB